MTTNLPRNAFANLPAPPPEGTLQFFDGNYVALPAGDYSLDLTHTVAPGTSNEETYKLSQPFTVQAPQFTIDATIVQSVFPPNGGTDQYDTTAASLVLADPSLPWERNIDPGGPPIGLTNPVPWMALLIFNSDEIVLQPGTSSPILVTTVKDVIAPPSGALGPSITVPDSMLSSQCQTITITAEAFRSLMPYLSEIPFLAHCRAVNTASEGETLLSVLLCNRLAIASAPSTQYYAHLVSLEGFSQYLGPDGTPFTQTYVQLVSLYNWSFTSLPESALNFSALVSGLIASEQDGSGGALLLPQPDGSAVQRLAQGYVPLTYNTIDGDQTFAWYRGPLSAVQPQPVPPVGDPPVDVSSATNADELTIYIADEGLFDLSYAAAWNAGRQLALADAQFTKDLNAMRLATNGALNAIAQRMALPHFAGENDPRVLLRRDASRRLFAQRMSEGLGDSWTRALQAARDGSRPDAPGTAPRIARRRGRIPPLELLARLDVVDAIGENIQDAIEAVGAWLAQLTLLVPVPFSHLVPSPAMLPVESIRFFYLDPSWLDALVAGATSIALHSTADVQILAAMRPAIDRARRRHQRRLAGRIGTAASGASGNGLTSGVLIRSQLVAGYPQLVVDPIREEAPMTILRDDTPSPSVRIVLFDGVPDEVRLAQPYQGLQFGVQDNGGANVVYPRVVTDPAVTGAQLNVPTVAVGLRAGGVLDIETLGTALADATGVLPYIDGATVNWNGTPLTTTFVSSSQLTATVDASAITTPGTALITVTSNGATSAPLTLVIDPALALNSIEPPMALLGTENLTLTVTGAGFDPSAAVMWDATTLKTQFVSPNQVLAAVPDALLASAGSTTITVSVEGTATNGITFDVASANPVIQSIQPAAADAGSPGFTLVVTGDGFGSDSVVQWSGTALTTTFVGEAEVTALVPDTLLATPGTVSITVATDGAASNALPFTIGDGSPLITSVSPSAAMAGGSDVSIEVLGVDFGETPVVQWNGSDLTTTVADTGELLATIPASKLTGAGIANIAVSTGSATSNSLPFTVLATAPVAGVLVPPIVTAGGGTFTLQVFGGFGAGDFALQMVVTPEYQSFTPQKDGTHA